MRVKLKLEQLGRKEVLKFAALDNYFSIFTLSPNLVLKGF